MYTGRKLVSADFMTRNEVAEELRVSVRTVDRYIADERLSAIKLGDRPVRIPRESVEAFLLHQIQRMLRDGFSNSTERCLAKDLGLPADIGEAQERRAPSCPKNTVYRPIPGSGCKPNRVDGVPRLTCNE